MRDNLIDFEAMKDKKKKEMELKEIEKQNAEKLEKDMELFKEITGKNTLFLTLEEMHAYREVGILCTFPIKDTYSMAIAVFRNQMYVINHIGGKFEFIGKLEDVISKGIFGE